MSLDNACSTSPTSKKSSSIDLKIISGGQTGVDRAALDFCLDFDIPCGGMCPAERKAEDGPIPKRYPLEESHSPDYRYRTRQNVLQAHGTLIIYNGKLGCGTQLTQNLCQKHKRPCLVLDAQVTPAKVVAEELKDFIFNHFIAILNVAGPRASSWQDGYTFVYQMLKEFSNL